MPVSHRTLRVMASHVGWSSLLALEEGAQVGKGTIGRWMRGGGISAQALQALSYQLEQPLHVLESLFPLRDQPASGDEADPSTDEGIDPVLADLLARNVAKSGRA